MDKKKLGALIAAVVAALTAFWYTYNAEIEKTEDTAPVAPVVEPAPVAPVEAPVVAPIEAPVEPAAPVEVK